MRIGGNPGGQKMEIRGADCGVEWTALRIVRMCGRYTLRQRGSIRAGGSADVQDPQVIR
jgi:hypothetical protein